MPSRGIPARRSPPCGRRHFWTERNPNLQAIAGEPGYRAVIAELERDMATQLEQVRKRVGETLPKLATAAAGSLAGRAAQEAP